MTLYGTRGLDDESTSGVGQAHQPDTTRCHMAPSGAEWIHLIYILTSNIVHIGIFCQRILSCSVSHRYMCLYTRKKINRGLMYFTY